jgi:hypothetical protein
LGYDAEAGIRTSTDHAGDFGVIGLNLCPPKFVLSGCDLASSRDHN